jgi:hypothetical protein
MQTVLRAPVIGVWNKRLLRGYQRSLGVCVYHSLAAAVKSTLWPNVPLEAPFTMEIRADFSCEHA